jgi:ribosome-binding factor A
MKKLKRDLAEAYIYLATYYEFKEKDDAKATENLYQSKSLIRPINR